MKADCPSDRPEFSRYKGVGTVVSVLELPSETGHDVEQVVAAEFIAAGLLQTWMYAGPLLAGCLNLALLTHARSRVREGRTLVPVRAHGVPQPHIPLDPALRPVVLRPYTQQPAVYSRQGGGGLA